MNAFRQIEQGMKLQRFRDMDEILCNYTRMNDMLTTTYYSESRKGPNLVLDVGDAPNDLLRHPLALMLKP